MERLDAMYKCLWGCTGKEHLASKNLRAVRNPFSLKSERLIGKYQLGKGKRNFE